MAPQDPTTAPSAGPGLWGSRRRLPWLPFQPGEGRPPSTATLAVPPPLGRRVPARKTALSPSLAGGSSTAVPGNPSGCGRKARFTTSWRTSADWARRCDAPRLLKSSDESMAAAKGGPVIASLPPGVSSATGARPTTSAPIYAFLRPGAPRDWPADSRCFVRVSDLGYATMLSTKGAGSAQGRPRRELYPLMKNKQVPIPVTGETSLRTE